MLVTDVSPCFLPTSHLFDSPTCWELERLPWSCNCPVERRWWEKCQSQSEMRFFVHFVLQLIISLFSIHLWIFLVTEKSILFLSLSGTSAWSTSFLLLAPSGALIAIPTYYWPSSTTPLFQITPVLNTGLSLSEPLQLYKGYRESVLYSESCNKEYIYHSWWHFLGCITTQQIIGGKRNKH